MGKRKASNLRINYPDSRPTVPTTSIHIHRTGSNRLGATSSVNRAAEVPAPATVPAGDDHAPPEDDPPDNPWSQSFFTSGDDTNPALDSSPSTVTIPTTSARPSRFLNDYLRYRQGILDHLIELDGRRGDHICHKCTAEEGIYRCEDCLHPSLWCTSCIVEQHTLTPLHRILRWNDGSFEDFSLQSLLTVTLGHDGGSCPGAPDIANNFVIIDVSGIHRINIAFCGCRRIGLSTHRRDLLLRHRLFPATLNVPQAAFTFDVLNTFHVLNLQSKISAYDFYRGLEHKTDNTGTMGLPDYYERFLDVMRAYRNLKAAKRSGRAHDPAGVNSTLPGQCAVECPACPHPGSNLPDGWQNATDDRWLYTLILTMDANFRLKNRQRVVRNDASLGDGWGHWVPSGPFLEHIEGHSQDIETNLCDSQFRAIDQANTKRSTGYASTGVGGVVCGRHGLVRRNGFGDLQKGERYANMDFILFQTLAGVVFRRLLLSYDIVCQYSRHLFTRMKELPSNLQIPEEQVGLIDFVIPKFHLYGHGSSCQLRYSLNLLPGCAHSDLEDPERWWAHINPISMSTKLMTPWARRETIDDHARGWNWRKITQFGSTLIQGLHEALAMKARHTSLHSKFTASFPQGVVQTWESEVLAWEKDPTKPNPFDNGEPNQDNMAAVRLELAREEANEINSESAGVGPVSFLCAGLEIEEKQRLLADSVREEPTANQAANIQEQRNILLRRIMAWWESQQSHMPNVASDLRADAQYSLDKPEGIPLFLPSQVPSSITSLQALRVKELRLRIGQANDALVELRRLLRITMGIWDFKFTSVGFSQRGNTRARSAINRFRDKVRRTSERYRAARRAILALDATHESLIRLKALHQNDIQCPQRQDETPGPGESRREISWIWLSVSSGSEGLERPLEDIQPMDPADITDCLKAEWSKSRARAARWSEEQDLILEEMRRVLAYLKWRASWWEGQATRRSGNVTPAVLDGLSAYATKQANTLRRLRRCFACMWRPRLLSYGLDAGWLSEAEFTEANITDNNAAPMDNDDDESISAVD